MQAVVPAKPSEHQLDRWRTVAEDVYRDHLSKPYPTETLPDDKPYTAGGVTIPRPNHALVHTLRSAAYVSLAVKAYNFFHKEKPIPESEIGKIQLALLFFIVGRENEASFTHHRVIYEKYRKTSAKLFERYIKSKPNLFSQFTSLSLLFYKQGVLDPYSDEDPRFLVIRFCHDLDLRRCYEEKDYTPKIKEAATHFGYLAGPISELAQDCIRATGDRIFDISGYDPTLFLPCSQSVYESIARIDAVFQRKQDEILHIIQYTSPPALDPIPKHLSTELVQPNYPWRLSPNLCGRLKKHASYYTYTEAEVLPGDKEWGFVWKYFQHQKPIRYGIKRILAIHNDKQVQVFEGYLNSLETETFPKNYTGPEAAQRQKVVNRWERCAEQFNPFNTDEVDGKQNIWKKVKVLPLFHGTKPEVSEKICQSGMTYFGKKDIPGVDAPGTKNTDIGFFGSGMYFTPSARYAADIFSRGHLFLCWVSMREPYPVIGDPNQTDMIKLKGGPAVTSYTAHYIPVVSENPSDPHCVNYYPAMDGEAPAWDEYVIFQRSQIMPQYLIELEPDYPYLMGPSITPKTVEELIPQVMKILQNPLISKDPKLVKAFNDRLHSLLTVYNKASPLDAEKTKFYQLLSTLVTAEGLLDQTIAEQLVNLQTLQNGPTLVKADPIFHDFMSKEIKRRSAIRQITANWRDIQWMEDWLKDDESVMYHVVTINAHGLRHGSDRIKRTESIVLRAIETSWEAVQYAEPKYPNYILAALKKNVKAMEYADHEFLTNVDFMYEAYIINKKALDYAPATVQKQVRDKLPGSCCSLYILIK